MAKNKVRTATVFVLLQYFNQRNQSYIKLTHTHSTDMTGQVPQYHIPARFVTLIPREFPASQVNAGANPKKRKSTSQGGSASKKAQDDFLAFDFGDGLGNFDALDLDFDKPLEDHEQDQDAFPPIM